MIFGAVIDPNMGDDIRITVIATGFERSSMPRRALERNPRENKRETSHYMRSSESVSVHADLPSSESRSTGTSMPAVSKDDLDIPTFLRNRR
jgi:cell division protein FtsZ